MKNIIKTHFQEILNRYNNGNASSAERKFLESFYDLYESNDDLITAGHEASHLLLKNEIRNRIDQRAGFPKLSATSIKLKLWIRYAGVAAVLLLMFASVFVFNIHNSSVNSFEQADRYIKPGGNNAVLTLANGKKIVLNASEKGKIAAQAGVSVIKTAEGLITYQVTEEAAGSEPYANKMFATNTITTPAGGQYTVVLPDGSRVQLNAASSLTYPTSFKKDERVVSLEGEAYFDVARQPERPFKVVSGMQTVEVLGTHFNINAYRDEAGIRTTLVEGSVKVYQDDRSALLKPGQQLLAVAGSQFLKRDVDVEKYIAWKNGLFTFEHDDIKTVMRQIARWYDVDISYDGDISGLEFSGELFRSSKLSALIKILELNKVHCELKGKMITVSYKE